MIVRPEPREMVRTKAAVLKSLRATLDARGFVEVETPILQLTNGGAAARPFRTHLNALDQEMLLRIALELDLKRAMIGGVDRVYEIGRTFRNEGLDSTHAAEFSMLEAYEAYGDQLTMMELAQGAGARRRAGRSGAPSVPAPRRQRDRPATASGARRRSSTWSPRRSARRSPSSTDDADPARLRRASTRSSCSRAGGPPRSSWSSTSSSSRTRWSSPRSSWTTRTPSSRWPSRTAPSPGLNEAWDLIINGVELGRRTPSSTTR